MTRRAPQDSAVLGLSHSSWAPGDGSSVHQESIGIYAGTNGNKSLTGTVSIDVLDDKGQRCIISTNMISGMPMIADRESIVAYRDMLNRILFVLET